MTIITTDHLNQALDIAERVGLRACDITDLRLTPDGELRAIVVLAAIPKTPSKRFQLEIARHP